MHMRVSGELVDVQLSDSRHKERHMKGYHAGNAGFFCLFFLTDVICSPSVSVCVFPCWLRVCVLVCQEKAGLLPGP